jgi:hypothetical protein
VHGEGGAVSRLAFPPTDQELLGHGSSSVVRPR